MKKTLVILGFIGLMFTGCTRTEEHMATGAALGAVAGHIVDGDRGALIGAGLGASAGALVADDERDDYKHHRKHHRRYYDDDDYDD